MLRAGHGPRLSYRGRNDWPGPPLEGRRSASRVRVTEKQQDEIAEIEATQAALRDSIERTKGLAEKAESLLQKHKKALQADLPPE